MLGNHGAVAVDAGHPVRDHGEAQWFGRHDLIVTAAALGAIVNALLFNIRGNAALRGQITSAHVFLRCSWTYNSRKRLEILGNPESPIAKTDRKHGTWWPTPKFKNLTLGSLLPDPSEAVLQSFP